MHGLAAALFFAGVRGHYERNTVEVERLACSSVCSARYILLGMRRNQRPFHMPSRHPAPPKKSTCFSA